MKFAKTCGHCNRSFTLTEAGMQPLSQVEQLLAQKEGLDWTRMVKVTCTECGTSSLVNEAELRAVTAGEVVDERLASMAARVRAVKAGVTHEVLSKWLENLAHNLDEASVAAISGRDRNGTAMSRAQLAEALERMRGEYAKGLDRLEQVAGADARARIGRVLEEMQEWTKGAPEARTTPTAPTIPDTIPFDIKRRYQWPQKCVCCLSDQVHAQVVVDSVKAGKIELANGQALAVPYCEPCAKHSESGAMAAWFMGCGTFLLLATIIPFLIAVQKGTFNPEKSKWLAIGAIVVAGMAMLAGGWRARRKVRSGIAGRGCAAVGQAVMGKGALSTNIVFRNLEYARLFIEANDLDTSLAPGEAGALAVATLFPHRAALIRDVHDAHEKKGPLLEIAKRHAMTDDDALKLAKQLRTEEKLVTRIQKDLDLVVTCERSKNQLLFIAEAASIAVLGGLADVIALSRDLESARMHLLRQKAIADNGVNISIASTTLLLIAAGIYHQADQLLKNRSEMFALLERNPDPQ